MASRNVSVHIMLIYVIHRTNHTNYVYITMTNRSAMTWNCVNKTSICLSVSVLRILTENAAVTNTSEEQHTWPARDQPSTARDQHVIERTYKHDENDSWGISGSDAGSVVTFAITVTCFLLLKLVYVSLYII